LCEEFFFTKSHIVWHCFLAWQSLFRYAPTIRLWHPSTQFEIDIYCRTLHSVVFKALRASHPHPGRMTWATSLASYIKNETGHMCSSRVPAILYPLTSPQRCDYIVCIL
jgi:hypothetical protein